MSAVRTHPPKHRAVPRMLREWRYAAFALVLSCCSGCTFMAMSGGGPVSKREAYAIFGAEPERVTAAIEQEFGWTRDPGRRSELRERTVTRDGQLVRIKRFRERGWWHCFFGGIGAIRQSDIITSAQGARTTYMRAQMFVPGYPLIYPYWQWREQAYLADESTEIARSSQYSLGLLGVLGGYVSAVCPYGMWQPMVEDYSRPLGTAGGLSKYKATRGWYLVGGLLAGGRVNHRYYLQLLWIPIPLWKAGIPSAAS